MDVPNWMKSKARKAREAAAADARRQQIEAEYAAANTPEKLNETGVAALIKLIKNYPDVRVYGKRWVFGHIVFDASHYRVEHNCPTSKNLLTVPLLQRDTVDKALAARYRQLGGQDSPSRIPTEMKQFIAQIENSIILPVADKKEHNLQCGEVEAALSRINRDIFVHLATRALGYNR